MDFGATCFLKPGMDAAPVTIVIDKPTAEATVSRLLLEVGFPAQSSVVERFSDLPEAVQKDAKSQGSDEKTTKGVYHNGTVFIVHENTESIADERWQAPYKLSDLQELTAVLRK